MDWSTFWTIVLQALITFILIIVCTVGILEVQREYGKKNRNK